MSIFRRKKKEADPIYKYMADVYDKMLVINEMFFTMIDRLYDNGLITYNQSRELMNITIDQIKDPGLKAEAMKRDAEHEDTLEVVINGSEERRSEEGKG